VEVFHRVNVAGEGLKNPQNQNKADLGIDEKIFSSGEVRIILKTYRIRGEEARSCALDGKFLRIWPDFEGGLKKVTAMCRWGNRDFRSSGGKKPFINQREKKVVVKRIFKLRRFCGRHNSRKWYRGLPRDCGFSQGS